MSDNIFRRVETKYLLDKNEKDSLLSIVGEKLEKDKYFSSSICNIYFDSEANDLIINSISKPIFKEKIRLRSYSVPSMSDNVYLEIKTKYKGVVGKRRIKLILGELYKYLDSGKMRDNQIMRELDYYFKYYNLKPSIYIGYDRNSYYSKEDENLRITFDSNLRSRRDNLKLELGREGKEYFKEEKYIMEIKSLNAMPLWLSRTLSELNIFPMSMSKYGSIYMEEIKESALC